jgi:hypothetical protein
VPPVEGVSGGGTSYGWVHDDIEGPSQLTGGDIDPTKIQSAELLHVWCMPSTANVGQQEAPRPLQPVSFHLYSFLSCYYVSQTVDNSS